MATFAQLPSARALVHVHESYNLLYRAYRHRFTTNVVQTRLVENYVEVGVTATENPSGIVRYPKRSPQDRKVSHTNVVLETYAERVIATWAERFMQRRKVNANGSELVEWLRNKVVEDGYILKV